MKSLSKFLLSFLIISSFILTPLSNQNTQAFSFSSLFDGDTYGDWLGEGDGGGSGAVNAQNCLTKSLSELEEAYKQNKGKAFAHATGHASVSQSEEDKKKAICEELINEEGDEEDTSFSETFLWKPVSDSDGKAVTLLPTSLTNLVIKTELLDAGNLGLDKGKFSGNANGHRDHFRFPKPGSSYGKGIQVVAVVAEGAWIWKIPDGGKRFESGKGRFVTNAEMAAWEAKMAAEAAAKAAAAAGSCPAGQTDTNTDKSVRVMAMGDSNTAGTESSNSLAYRKAFKENMLAKGYTVDMVGSQSSGTGLSDNQHEGYGGRGIAHLQSIASGTSLNTYNPNVILLLVGSNDMWVSLDNRTPITDSAANSKVTALGTLLDTIHTKLPNAKIIVAKPGTPEKGGTAATRPLGIYRTGISTLASTRSYVSVVDFTGFDNDGTHYSAAGYNSIAETFANKVDEITRKCTGSTTSTYTTKALCESATGFVCAIDTTQTCNDTPSSATSTSQNMCAAKWKPTSTKLPTSGGKLKLDCKVSDTTPGVDDEVDIWLEVSGGKKPYDGKWSGDYKKATDFDKDKSDQTVSFEKRGNYKIKATVTDGNGDDAKDTCPTIKVTSDGVDDDVVVKVDNNNNANNTQNNSATSNYPFSRDLTIGSTGADVTALQQFLVGQGFLVMPAGVNYGYFGVLTQTALGNWQAARGITPSAGYFGAKTRAAMSGGYVAPASSYVAPAQTYVAPTNTSVDRYYQSINTVAPENTCVNLTSTIYFGEENDNIGRVQKFLETGGYLVMPAGAGYGYYGKTTVTALSKFMAVRGITHNGAVMDSKVLGEVKTVSCK